MRRFWSPWSSGGGPCIEILCRDGVARLGSGAPAGVAGTGPAEMSICVVEAVFDQDAGGCGDDDGDGAETEEAAWRRLSAYAERRLVEGSERSRLAGAGAGWSTATDCPVRGGPAARGGSGAGRGRDDLLLPDHRLERIIAEKRGTGRRSDELLPRGTAGCRGAMPSPHRGQGTRLCGPLLPEPPATPAVHGAGDRRGRGRPAIRRVSAMRPRASRHAGGGGISSAGPAP